MVFLLLMSFALRPFSGDFGPHDKLNRSVERHIGDAQRHPRVPAAVAENGVQQIGGAVDHLGMLA